MNAIQRVDAYFNDWNTHDTDACKIMFLPLNSLVMR